MIDPEVLPLLKGKETTIAISASGLSKAIRNIRQHIRLEPPKKHIAISGLIQMISFALESDKPRLEITISLIQLLVFGVYVKETLKYGHDDELEHLSLVWLGFIDRVIIRAKKNPS